MLTQNGQKTCPASARLTLANEMLQAVDAVVRQARPDLIHGHVVRSDGVRANVRKGDLQRQKLAKDERKGENIRRRRVRPRSLEHFGCHPSQVLFVWVARGRARDEA